MPPLKKSSAFLLAAAAAASFFAAPVLAGNPHVVKLANGEMHPDAGYAWVNPAAPGDFRTTWEPGSTNPDFPNVIAGATEGKWNPAPGFRWANDRPGDLTVVAIPNPQMIAGAAAKIVGAETAVVIARIEVEKHPKSTGAQIAYGLAMAARPPLVTSAWADVLPGATEQDIANATNLLNGLVDTHGKLLDGITSREQQIEALINKLTEGIPEMRQTRESAEFILRAVLEVRTVELQARASH